MPRYDYECASCGRAVEITHPADRCDDTRPACTCGGCMRRAIPINLGAAVDRNYRMSAIYSDGRRVRGHFGEPRRGKYTPGF